MCDTVVSSVATDNEESIRAGSGRSAALNTPVVDAESGVGCSVGVGGEGVLYADATGVVDEVVAALAVDKSGGGTEGVVRVEG